MSIAGTTLRVTICVFTIVSCSPVKPEPEYCEPVIIEKDRIVPVPGTLTQPVEIIELSPDFDVYELGAAYQAQKVRSLQCNGKLAEISNITEQ